MDPDGMAPYNNPFGGGILDRAVNYATTKAKQFAYNTVVGVGKAAVNQVRETLSDIQVSVYGKVEDKSTVGGRASGGIKGVQVDANGSSVETASFELETRIPIANDPEASSLTLTGDGEFNYMKKDGNIKHSAGGSVEYGAGGSYGYERVINDKSKEVISEKHEIAVTAGAGIVAQLKASSETKEGKTIEQVTIGGASGSKLGLMHVIEINLELGIKLKRERDE